MSRFYTDVQLVGNTILHSYYDQGIRYRDRLDYAPSLYINSNKEEIYKTIYGQNLSKIDFLDIDGAKAHIKSYKDVHGYKIFANNKWANNFISTQYPADSVEYDFDNLSVSTVDIETTAQYGGVNVVDAAEEILLITIHNNKKGIITFGSRPYEGIYKDNYVLCNDEYALLKTFLTYWRNNYPDILTSWNGDTFDVPYIVRRMEKTIGTEEMKFLSPWRIVREKMRNINNKDVITYLLHGIQQLDYLALYKKFRLIPRPNYRLDTICEEELGEGKLQNPGDSFIEFYTDHWETFVNYNVRDVTLIVELEAKLKLIEVATTMSYSSHVNYSDVFSPVALWESIINSYLLNKNVIIPLERESFDVVSYDGAFVKQPKGGLKGWLCSFDAASLYPSIIMALNISPETLIPERQPVTIDGILNHEYTPAIGCTLAANGTQYSKDFQGFLPALMRKFFDSRVTYKCKMIEAKKLLETCTDETEIIRLTKVASAMRNMEQGIKISINAAYGALANNYFKYYDVRLAEAITLTGQSIIKFGNLGVNKYYHETLKLPKDDYVIYCDTDSLYISFQPLVDKFCVGKSEDKIVDFIDTVCKTKFKDMMGRCFQEFFDSVGGFENTINFKRESICSKGFWTKKKKRYALKVHDQEGVRYSTPQIKITGLACISSTTPKVTQKLLKKCIDIILNGDVKELRIEVEKMKKDFLTYSPEEISIPRGVNDIGKYMANGGGKLYKGGTPLANRAVILYNHYLKENKLEGKYTQINNGDKIKYVYLLRNVMKENVIGYPNTFPDEIVDRKYIDYDTQCLKTFIDPLNIMLDGVDWELNEKLKLDEFFC